MDEEELKDEIERIAGPLQLLITEATWSDPEKEFCPIKCAALSIVASLAYCDVNREERRKPRRAIVVPCDMFQKIIYSQEISFQTVMEILEGGDVEVLRTEKYVAIVVAVGDLLLIGVRGTLVAYEYYVNLKIYSRLGKKFEIDARFHAGFLKDAEELSVLIEEYILDKYCKNEWKGEKLIYFSGHSLGGAVASILRHMRIEIPQTTASPSNSVSSNGCYIFGSPRVGSNRAMHKMEQPFAIRRQRDIVPFCPPN